MKKSGWLSFTLLFLCACSYHGGRAPAREDIRDVMLTQPRSFFYVDTAAYPRQDPSLPIGMFDSGTGGLTVLDAVVRFDGYGNNDHKPGHDGLADFSRESFIYLGDQANMPYGDYAQENNLPLLREHIFKDLQFLLGRRYYPAPQSKEPVSSKPPVKAIVIACNTATAFGKVEIERFLGRAGLDLKVIGVIDAGVRGALDCFTKEEEGAVAVMATPGTVSSNGYQAALAEQMEVLGYTGRIILYQQAGHGLAGAIDGESAYIDPQAVAPRAEYRGPALTHAHAVIDPAILPRYGFDWEQNHMLWEGRREEARNLQINSIENYIRYNLVSLLEQLRKAPGRQPLKVLILGCTHYPFYLDFFNAELARLRDYQEKGLSLYRPFMADTIHLVDPAVNTARELYEYLDRQRLFAGSEIDASRFFISVPNRGNPAVELDAAGAFSWGYKYGRPAGVIQEYVKCVPFSRETVPAEVMARFARTIPETSALIERFMRQNEIINP